MREHLVVLGQAVGVELLDGGADESVELPRRCTSSEA